MKWLLFMPLFLHACSKGNNTTENSCISLLIDVTDTMAFPSPDELARYIENHSGLWGRTTLRLGSIYEYEPSSSIEFTLESEIRLLSNEITRKAKRKRFIALIAKEIERIITTQAKRNNSSVIPVIGSECTYLSEQTGRKYLLVLSDLCQNSTSLSVYTHTTVDSCLLAAIEMNFRKYLTVSSLSHTSITFLYLPKDINSNDRFTILAGLYKRILEDKGAQVTVEATLTINRFVYEP